MAQTTGAQASLLQHRKVQRPRIRQQVWKGGRRGPQVSRCSWQEGLQVTAWKSAQK